MFDHVSPWLEMLRTFNQLMLSACLVNDIASVSLAQEYLVRGLGYKCLPVAFPLASYTEVLIHVARHTISLVKQTGKSV